VPGRRPLLALPPLAFALVLAGCGGLDSGKIEEEISEEIEERSQGQVKVRSVDCPDDVEAKKGDRFTCRVTAENGRSTRVVVVQTSDDGDVRFYPNFFPLLG